MEKYRTAAQWIDFEVEIRVIYFEKDAITGKPIRRRASLQQLLVRAGVAADTVDDLSPSPAVLMLKTMNLMMKHLSLRAKLEMSATGMEPEQTQVVQVSWIRAILEQNGQLQRE